MLSSENKKQYPEYKRAREQIIELHIAKNNVEMMEEKKRNRQQETQ